jgi:superfamily II DNA or RNA helicase
VVPRRTEKENGLGKTAVDIGGNDQCTALLAYPKRVTVMASEPTLRLTYTADDIARSFGTAVLVNGRGLAAAGQVHNLFLTHDQRAVEFHVVDYDDEHYECTLTLTGGRSPTEFIVTTDCECGVANCVHGAAGAFYGLLKGARRADGLRSGERSVRRRESDPFAQQVRAWIDEPMKFVGQQHKDDTEQVRYALTLAVTNRGIVPRISVYGLTRKADGSYGKPRALQPTYVETPQTAYQGLSVLLLASGLCESDRYQGWGMGAYAPITAINPRLAATALLQVLDTGQLYYRTVEGLPLHYCAQPAEPLVWNQAGDGHVAPGLASRPQALLLPTDPIWYVEPVSGDIGPVDIGLPIEVALRAVTIPPLSPELARDVHRVWHRTFPPGTFGPPKTDLSIELRTIEPTPHLTLSHTKSRTPWGSIEEDTGASLTFDYNGTMLSPKDPRQELETTRGKTIVISPRNTQAEAAAAKLLEDAGLWSDGSYRTRVDGRYTFARGGDTTLKWATFLQHTIPRLRELGWVVMIAKAFPVSVTEPTGWDVALRDVDNQWFELDIGVDVDGRRVALLPIVLEALGGLRIRSTKELDKYLEEGGGIYAQLGDGNYIHVPKERISTVLRTMVELFDDPALTDKGRLKLSRAQTLGIENLDKVAPIHWQGATALRTMLSTLAEMERHAPAQRLPKTFKGQLRPYQEHGVAWMQMLREHRFGGVLADDMGLGKTVQVIAHLTIEKAAKRLDCPALVVVKTSGLPHWESELAKFAPSLRVLTYTTPGRFEHEGEIDNVDVVLTTHSLLHRNDGFDKRQWSIVVLDEAQAMKNPRSQLAIAACALKAKQVLALSGTPVENNLEDLHSICSFATPGLLGDRKRFGRLFRTPIEKHDDDERRVLLGRRIRPFMLRRTKEAVAKDLPKKSTLVTEITLSGAQRDLYETIRTAMLARVQAELRTKGLARSHIVVLDALLKLRQVCCDPRLVKLPSARGVKQSNKLDMLMEMLPELIEDGRRILLFSQFTEMLDLIKSELERNTMSFVELRGDTRDRKAPVDRFNKGDVPLFLISLKAGGTSLNLQAADTVIHYDPWWNPAVESQATDRAHRIGQTQPVFVYKLITVGTVEERIVAMQERKGKLAAQVLGAGGSLVTLGVNEIEALFAPI